MLVGVNGSGKKKMRASSPREVLHERRKQVIRMLELTRFHGHIELLH